MGNAVDNKQLNDISIPYEDDDPLPENCCYRDEGCELAKSCLNCPFEECVYISNATKKANTITARRKEIVILHANGMSIDELIKHFRLDRRTIMRDLRAIKTNTKGE